MDGKDLRFEGRILEKEGVYYLAYTNSSVSFRAEGSAVWMEWLTEQTEVVNLAGLRVYVDGEAVGEVVLDKPRGLYEMCRLTDGKPHLIRVVKITEAAMSFAGLADIRVENGGLLPGEFLADERVKVEFIGDSITCGYGVHGAPESEFTIREEDGECSYAALMAKRMNWNGRYIAASGYGMYVEYTGNPDNCVPKLYPYVNWFVDREKRIDPAEFHPAFIFVNLGTNDSGHLGDERIREGFVAAYEKFLYQLKEFHPKAEIICVIGTLCTNVFPLIEEIVERVKAQKGWDIYALELPFHDVERDGMASWHPSLKTHQKDAERILEFMERQGLLR